MDLLCKHLWVSEGQITLYRQKFLRSLNKHDRREIVLSLDIW